MSTWVGRLDVDVFTLFAFEAAVAGTFVAAVEVLSLSPPQPASTMDATAPTNNGRLSATPPRNPVETAEYAALPVPEHPGA